MLLTTVQTETKELAVPTWNNRIKFARVKCEYNVKIIIDQIIITPRIRITLNDYITSKHEKSCACYSCDPLTHEWQYDNVGVIFNVGNLKINILTKIKIINITCDDQVSNVNFEIDTQVVTKNEPIDEELRKHMAINGKHIQVRKPYVLEKTDNKDVDLNKIHVLYPSHITSCVSNVNSLHTKQHEFNILKHNITYNGVQASELSERIKLSKLALSCIRELRLIELHRFDLIYYSINGDSCIYDNELDDEYIQGSGNDIEPEEF
jgi:hypothetical protein